MTVPGREIGSDGSVALWLDRDYAGSVQVQSVTPAPGRVAADADRLVYRAERSASELIVTFHLRPEDAGPLPGAVGVERGPSVALWQFVYP